MKDLQHPVLVQKRFQSTVISLPIFFDHVQFQIRLENAQGRLRPSPTQVADGVPDLATTGSVMWGSKINHNGVRNVCSCDVT